MLDESQTIINWLFGIVCAGGGWFLRMLWIAVQDLQTADTKLVDKVNKIEVLVAGNYMTRAEHAESMRQIIEKLNSIDTKLDRKVDR